jgi:hypothetical protein
VCGGETWGCGGGGGGGDGSKRYRGCRVMEECSCRECINPFLYLSTSSLLLPSFKVQSLKTWRSFHMGCSENMVGVRHGVL